MLQNGTDYWSCLERLVPLANILGNLAIIIGVWLAYRQLKAWKVEHLAKRKAETAELLLSRAMNVKSAIASVRSGIESIPADTKDSQQEVIELKWERLRSYDDDFDRLRELQVLHEALVGTRAVKDAIDDLFSVRQEIFAALSTLNGWKLGADPRDEHVKLQQDLRAILYAMGTEHDKLRPRIHVAIETLRDHLLPEIRMQRK
ncbi:hypothetical protein SAMN04488005_3122 [Yoonia tamlensis]|uniref:Uncharacterized protein n=1 Tax=Yoonia tamlensis TaxID=390270 RepID=A0A1I6HYK4_9RHOB|nr:hypothetical protein SAMN04488005_3122 [Yoonia tamlensis]